MFTKVDKNLVCEFHVTTKKQLFTHENSFDWIRKNGKNH